MKHDLSNFENAAEQGAPLELLDPAGRPLLYEVGTNESGPIEKPVTIWLAGTTSQRWTKAADALANKLQDMKETRSVQDIRNDRASILAKMTLRWEGVVVDGAELPFSEANAQKLYVRFPFILEQIDKFLAKKENFLPASQSA